MVPLCRRRGSGDRVSGNILGASACAGSRWPQRTFLPQRHLQIHRLAGGGGTGRRSDGGDRLLSGTGGAGAAHLASNRNHPAPGSVEGIPSVERGVLPGLLPAGDGGVSHLGGGVSFGKKQAASIHDRKRLLSLLCPGLSGYGLHRNGEIGKRAVRPPRRWAGRGTVQAGRRFPRSLCSVAERASPHRSPLGGMQGRQQHPHRLHRTPGCTWLLSGGGRSCGDPDD